MGFHRWTLLPAIAACIATFLSPVDAAATEGTVLRVQVGEGSDSREGTCFVIHQEERDNETIVFFLTSARLFDEHRQRRVRVVVDESETLDIPPDGVFLPYGNLQHVAVLRAVSTSARWVTMPIVFEPVYPGSVFVISGYHPDGTRALVTQHVRFVATRTVLGDRAAASVAGCRGAPAIVERGVFGVVSECEPDRVPIVTPLSAVRSFIIRTVPGLTATQSDDPQFTLGEREIIGPLLEVPSGEVRQGEIEIRIDLGAREAAVSATAHVVSRTSLRIADVTVLSLKDRSVKLRFTLGGTPPPATPAPWPQAQALILVRVNLVLLPTP